MSDEQREKNPGRESETFSEDEATASTHSSTEALLADDLAKAIRERDEYLALWQRAQADYQNQRRRAANELEMHVRSALEPLLEDLLLVADHLDMALKSPQTSEDARNLGFGVELVRGQVRGLLDRAGVQGISTEGAFDPTLHQAVAQVERADLPPGTCVETVRPGYLFRGRPLRHAQVKVSSSPSAEASGTGEGQAPGQCNEEFQSGI